jgi:hypothetical protein
LSNSAIIDPKNTDSDLTIDPSRPVTFKIEHALLGREDAELVTMTVIDKRMSNGLKKGTRCCLTRRCEKNLRQGGSLFG